MQNLSDVLQVVKRARRAAKRRLVPICVNQT